MNRALTLVVGVAGRALDLECSSPPSIIRDLMREYSFPYNPSQSLVGSSSPFKLSDIGLKVVLKRKSKIYFYNGTQLKYPDSEIDFEITVSNNLNPSQQCSEVAKNTATHSNTSDAYQSCLTD
ncbi:hypothetical protein E2C01_086102 [Portunus trituberculatus]|uniref:Uncharacterized protein n=1 Tax=Portunus trituberculatus TaxID=210409 RepID=A0A5B7JCJ4_PORTR|nr:hypothetical protein [Portunus trituberculatus]